MLNTPWDEMDGKPPVCQNCKAGFVENRQVVQFQHAAGEGLLHVACVRDYVLRFLSHYATRDELLAIIHGTEVFARVEVLRKNATRGKQ